MRQVLFDATTMREVADNANFTKDKRQAVAKIRKAAKCGKYFIVLRCMSSELLLNHLRELGFNVIDNTNAKTQYGWVIDWSGRNRDLNELCKVFNSDVCPKCGEIGGEYSKTAGCCAFC